ncbi:hypothetical protein PQR64_06085 [Paraburkholderia phytofirmans]|uniref:hypothetical protein n=1 Tax=Paraburkholderia phytofirmans TaxID=261302 RepID=UPI0038B9ABB1
MTLAALLVFALALSVAAGERDDDGGRRRRDRHALKLFSPERRGAPQPVGPDT